MARSHGETTIERDTQAPTAYPQPVRVDAKGLSREHPRRRTVAAIGAWLGTSTWPAYCAAAITTAYGLLKAYWVFGGSALWSIAPLPDEPAAMKVTVEVRWQQSGGRWSRPVTGGLAASRSGAGRRPAR